MAEIRCPMCGNPNPAEADICQVCQARLKPLTITPDSPKPDEDIIPTFSPEEASSIPEWLDSLRAGDDHILEDKDSSTAIEGEHEKGEESPPQTPTGDQDWLSDFRQESPRGEGEYVEPDASSEAPFDENIENGSVLPEWLVQLRSSSPEDKRISSLEGEKEETGDEPDWLKDLRINETDKEKTFSGETRQPDNENLTKEDLYSAESETSAIERPLSPQDDNLVLTTEESETIIPSGTGSLSIPDEELPDWLNPRPEPGEEISEKVPPEEIKPEKSKTPLDAPGKEELTPDMLAGLPAEETSATDQTIEADQPDRLNELDILDETHGESKGVEVNPMDANYPEWIEAIGETPETHPSTKEESLPEFFQGTIPPFNAGIDELLDEIPEWLDQAPMQESREEITPTEDQKQDLGQDELPDWIKAKRSQEGALPVMPIYDESDKRVESAGPLSGMRGVLPAEPDIAREKPAPSYSLKIQVSEKQKNQTDLIASIVQTEGEVKPLPDRLTIKSQTVLRVGIFIVLILAILLPMLTGFPVAPLPMYSVQTYDFSQVVNQLPGAAPVLLAFDYEPGLSGEIEAISSIALDHLMVKSAYFAIVSTVPTGPLQAERLISSVNASGEHNYQAGNQFVNMGFIPGGQSGLLALAENPRQVIPFDLRGEPVWEIEFLRNIQKLSDFSLVLVLTENPDNARAWIEQVQPLLAGTPLVFVSSAQVEPIIQPYYASNAKQVSGIIAGISAGVSYEKLVPRSGLASHYWNSYSLGIFVAVVMVVLGGIISISTLLLSLKKFGNLEEE
jgi:hypothetical protein